MTAPRLNAPRNWSVLMLAVAASLAGAPAAHAAGAAGGAEAGASSLRATLESKLRLVKLLLAQSPALQRIPHSDNAVAKKKLAEAQGLYASAQAESGAEAAIGLLDDALRQIVAASRLVPDPQQQAAQERRRNTELREAIAGFQKLQQGMAGRERLDALVARADALGAAGDQHGAGLLLNQAYQTVVPALNSLLAAQTIVYDLKFATPQEEWRHELARNRSYEDLIPIALAQLHLAPDTVGLAQGYARQSRALRDTAQQQASGDDYRAAVKTVQDATSHLQRALRTAGVVVPSTSEFQP